MKNEQQSQNLLLKVDPRSTFRNNFLQPATNAFVTWQVDHKGEKHETSTQNLQRNNVARQVEAFRISYFAAFRQLIKQSKLRHFLCYASPQFISFFTHFKFSLVLIFVRIFSLGPDKFAEIFLGEFDTPEAIWNSEMR